MVGKDLEQTPDLVERPGGGARCTLVAGITNRNELWSLRSAWSSGMA
jgi:hypothetical protein